MKACLHCRRACKRLWCETCIARGMVSMRREYRKPLSERKVYRDLDYPAFLARTREALEVLERSA